MCAGKSHKKGACDVVCTGCGMKGSHKVDKYWKIHPELKPRNMMNGKKERDRGRYREKSRSRSRDKEVEGNKRGREKSPYPRHHVRRVASGDREDTDRDTDESQENFDLKEAERERRKAQEKVDREKKNV